MEEYNFKVDDVLKIIKKKKIKCLMCSKSEFFILVNDDIYYNVLKENYNWNTLWKVINTIKLECQDCGFVMEYNPYLLMMKFIYQNSKVHGDENAPLKKRQKDFVKYLVEFGNIEKAAIMAGYPSQTAHATGTKLMSSSKIINAINKELKIQNDKKNDMD